MAYRQLFLLVEGENDARFFEYVLIPLLNRDYQQVKPVQVRAWRKEKLKSFLRSVQAMGADYLLVRDLDFHPCVTAARDTFIRHHPFVDPARIQIVKVEIESWYCAGIPANDPEFGTLKIATCSETDGVNKESFDTAIGQQGRFRNPILLALLERFDLETAARRNGSFRYFLRKYLKHGVGA